MKDVLTRQHVNDLICDSLQKTLDKVVEANCTCLLRSPHFQFGQLPAIFGLKLIALAKGLANVIIL